MFGFGGVLLLCVGVLRAMIFICATILGWGGVCVGKWCVVVVCNCECVGPIQIPCRTGVMCYDLINNRVLITMYLLCHIVMLFLWWCGIGSVY